MKKPLEVLITSGGTIAKIDDIRHIGNFSSGTTGALIAEEFLKNGHKVNYVYGKNSKTPFKRNLIIDVNKPKEQELERLSMAYEEYNKYRQNLIEIPIATFQEYYNKLEELTKSADVIVLAAAVGDYSPIRQEGKISSDKDELVIRMQKNPKVIQHIKEWNPKTYLVGFKLLSNVGDKELLNIAKTNAEKTHSDMTVANLFPGTDFRNAKTYILYDGGELPVNRQGLASTMVNLIEYSVNKKVVIC